MNNLLALIKETTSKLSDSSNSMTSVIESITDNLFNPGDTTTDNVDQAAVLSGGIGTRFTTSIINGVKYFSTYTADENNDGKYTKLIDSMPFSSLNVDSLINISDDASMTMQDILQSLSNSINVNDFIIGINDWMKETGSISKSTLMSMIDSASMTDADKLDVKALLASFPDTLQSKDYIQFVSLFYSSWNDAHVSGSNTIELNETRGSVASFKITCFSLVGIGTISDILSTVLLFIPGIVSKVLAVGAMIISKGINFVANATTAISCNSQGLIPSLKAPIVISKSDSPVLDLENELSKNSAVVTRFRDRCPMVTCSVRRTDENDNTMYYRNGYVLVSKDIEDPQLHTMVEYLRIGAADQGYHDWSSNERCYKTADFDFVKACIYGCRDIDYTGMDMSARSENYISNTVLVNYALFIMMRLLPINGNYYVVYYDNDYEIEHFTDNWSRFMATCCAIVFKAFSVLMSGDFESNIGINAVEHISNFVNWMQDSAADFPAAGQDVQFNGAGPGVGPYGYLSHSHVNMKPSLYLIKDIEDLWISQAGVIDLETASMPSSFVYDLPNYSRPNVIRAIALISGVILGSCIAVVSAKALLRKPAFRKRMDRAKELKQLTDRYNNNPTDANFKELYKKTKSYNFSAKLFGWNTYDPVNAWFDSPGADASSSVQVMKLIKLISG